jgi:hypothetical protein
MSDDPYLALSSWLSGCLAKLAGPFVVLMAALMLLMVGECFGCRDCSTGEPDAHQADAPELRHDEIGDDPDQADRDRAHRAAPRQAPHPVEIAP